MPFCPQCKDEYEEGYTVCADCGCPLVDSLPASKPAAPVQEPKAMRPVLLHTCDAIQGGFLSGILEHEGIVVLSRDQDVLGDYMSIYMGYSVYGKRLYVDRDDYEKSVSILNEFETLRDIQAAEAPPEDFERQLPYFQRPTGRAQLIFFLQYLLSPIASLIVLFLVGILS